MPKTEVPFSVPVQPSNGVHPHREHVSTDELEILTGIKSKTWEALRAKGEGPRYFKMGKRLIKYGLREVIEWIESHEVKTTEDGV